MSRSLTSLPGLSQETFAVWGMGKVATEGKGKPRCLHFAPSSKLDSWVCGFGHDLFPDRLLQSPPTG